VSPINPVQYIILNKGLGMTTGKAAAQAAHASVQGLYVVHGEEGRRNPWDASIVNRWMRGGHYAKVVLEVPDESALMTAERYIADRGFKVACIIDEGRTEIEPFTRTALGSGVVDKDSGHVRETFGQFKLYDDRPVVIEGYGEEWTSPGLTDERLSFWDRVLHRSTKEKGDAE
jgi:peptidyl-tRNA hydrolase